MARNMALPFNTVPFRMTVLLQNAKWQYHQPCAQIYQCLMHLLLTSDLPREITIQQPSIKALFLLLVPKSKIVGLEDHIEEYNNQWFLHILLTWINDAQQVTLWSLCEEKQHQLEVQQLLKFCRAIEIVKCKKLSYSKCWWSQQLDKTCPDEDMAPFAMFSWALTLDYFPLPHD